MIDLFLRFGVALHVALMVVYSSWARGGSSSQFLWALPWLSLGLIEIMLLMPPKSRDESPVTATKRLLKSIFLDPITYIGLALIAYLLVQWLNGPCELVYDTTLARWGYTDPPWPSLPFCVDRADALSPLIWFSTVTVAILAVRHAMRPSARYYVLKIFVINGALLSLVGFLQTITCPGKLLWCVDIPVYFFSTFGYPNHAGTFFVMMTALNMGLVIRALGDKQERGVGEVTWMALTFFLNAAGIYGSLCRASIILGTLVIIFGFIYGLAYLHGRISKTQLAAATILIGVIAAGVAVFAFTPGSPLKKELDSIDFSNLLSVYGRSAGDLEANESLAVAEEIVPAEVPKSESKISTTGIGDNDRGELADAAIEIWKDYPWTGVGGYGFRYYVGMYGIYKDENNWEKLESAGRANVHNDALQFLCEHGMIGFGLMVAMVLVLIVHTIIRMTQLKRVVDLESDRQYSWFMSVSPCVWAVFAAAATMVVHSTIDLPFRSIANTLVWFVILACLPGFLPRKDKAERAQVKAEAKPESNSEHHHHHHHHHHGEQ